MRKVKQYKQKSKGTKGSRNNSRRKASKYDEQSYCSSNDRDSDYFDESVTNNTYDSQLTTKRIQKQGNQKREKIIFEAQHQKQSQQCELTLEQWKQYQQLVKSECKLQQKLDLQIKQIFISFFRTQDIPNHIIVAAKNLLLQQIQRVLSQVVRRHVIIRNKTQTIQSFELIEIVQMFGASYKYKILRTFMIEQASRKANPNKKQKKQF